MESTHSRTVRVVILLETYLPASVRVGLGGALLVGSGFLLYIVVGFTADTLGWVDPPYPFLSLEADPFFVIGGAVIGVFVVQSASSLLLYQYLAGVESDRSEFTIL